MEQESPISIKMLTILSVTSVLIVSVAMMLNYLDNDTKLVFCESKSSSVVYIRVHNKTDILVNAGEDKKALDCLSRNMPFYDRDLDNVILSYSKTNYAGMKYILNRYKINKMYLDRRFLDSKTTDELDTYFKQYPSKLEYITPETSFSTTNSTFHFIYPDLQGSPIVIFNLGEKVIVLAGHVPVRYLKYLTTLNFTRVSPENLYLLQIPKRGLDYQPLNEIIELADPTHLVLVNYQNGSIGSVNRALTVNANIGMSKDNYLNNKTDVVYAIKSD